MYFTNVDSKCCPKTEAYNLSTIYGSLLFSNNFNKPIILVGNVLNNFTKDLVPRSLNLLLVAENIHVKKSYIFPQFLHLISYSY